MPRRTLARAGLALSLALPLASCSDVTDPAEHQTDASPSPGASSEAGVLAPDAGHATDIDAAVDAALASAADAARAAALAACVERPGALPSAPSGELPCTLLPPGFSR